MKTIAFTSLFLGLLCFALHTSLRNQAQLVRRDIANFSENRETLNTPQKQKRFHKFQPSGSERDSPFVIQLYQDLGSTNATTLDILEKLRGLRIDEVKILSRQLLDQNSKTVAANQSSLIEATELVLLEADPLFLLNDDELRTEAYGVWAKRASTAFQSLLKKDPKTAREYFERIPLDDFQSNKWPFSKIYREMMGYLFAHDPKGAIKFYQLQKESIRNLPWHGSRRQLTSMDQVMPYAKLLRAENWADPSVSQLLGWACEEADRLEGPEGLLRFSKAWAGPASSERRQRELFLTHGMPITTRERADGLLSFAEKEGIPESELNLWSLVSDWSEVDVRGASQWVKEQTRGAERDRMIEALLSGFAWSDPAAIQEWLPLIHDDGFRAERLKIIEGNEAPYRNK